MVVSVIKLINVSDKVIGLSTEIRGVKGLRGVKGQFFNFVLTDSIII